MLLEVNGLTKYFGGLAAVSNLDFSIEKGEIVGLIGPNGAGKTTVFNLISGVSRPTAGTVKFNGKKIDGRRPDIICKMGIGRTYQIVRPFMGMTVLDNLLVGLLFGSKSKKNLNECKHTAMELLRFVGLEQESDVLAKSLILVKRRRLEVARALSTDPELLLLDEVMAGLNETEVADSMKLIREIRNKGIAVLIIEHVMKAIMDVSDRIVVLSQGMKIAEGKPQEIARNEEVVKAYLGEAVA